MSDEAKNDAVKAEEYNKVVEAHNSMKIEKEKIERELNDMKRKDEVKTAIDGEKQKWDKEKAEMIKQQEDLKKQAENKTAVAKGVVNPNTIPDEIGDFKNKLDKVIPEAKNNPDRIVSAIGRYKHFKSPSSRFFTKQEFGYGIAAHAVAQRINPNLISEEAKASSGDIIIKKN
jgi:hypothetical protein